MIHSDFLTMPPHSAGSLNHFSTQGRIHLLPGLLSSGLAEHPSTELRREHAGACGSYAADVDLRPSKLMELLVSVWMKSAPKMSNINSINCQAHHKNQAIRQPQWRQSHLHQPLHGCELRRCTAENRLFGRSSVEKTRPKASVKVSGCRDVSWILEDGCKPGIVN